MVNILFILASLAAIITFLDKVVLRGIHKKQLQEKFSQWHEVVEQYDRLKLALLFAAKTGDFLDFVFGEKLLSRRVWIRCGILSTIILSTALGVVGIAEKQTFGVTPWKNYRESIFALTNIVGTLTDEKTMNSFYQATLYSVPAFFKNTNAFVLNINSNYFVVQMVTNVIKNVTAIEPLGRGGISIGYVKTAKMDDDSSKETNASFTFTTNVFGNIVASSNQIFQLVEDGKNFKKQLMSYDRPRNTVLYSIFYFVAVVLLNSFLFTMSLALCRVVIREISMSSIRLLPTASLVTMNWIFVGLMCLFAVLLFTTLALPIFWFLIPFVIRLADHSIYTLTVYSLGASITVWLLTSFTGKVVTLITFIPSVFAGIIGLLSLLVIKYRNGFYYVLVFFLIRCKESSPIVIIGGTIAFISAVVGLIAKYIHITGFL